jgi:hypothetical protein
LGLVLGGPPGVAEAEPWGDSVGDGVVGVGLGVGLGVGFASAM